MVGPVLQIGGITVIFKRKLPTDVHNKGQSPDTNTEVIDLRDDSLMEIQALVDKINMLTKLVREIDAMPIISKINKLPF